MASDLCRVRTVRLRAPRDDLVRRGAILLEDALHTAARPDSPGRRLLIVRSLGIGAIRASGGAATVALVVERKLRELEARAVHALDAAAPTRDAVYFRDDVEAYATLAIRVAAQRPTDAWFWPLAVPMWHPGMPRDDALRALLLAAGESRAGATAAAALVAAVAERGALDALLGALRPPDGSALLHVLGWSAGGEDVVDLRVTSPRPPALAPARMRALERWVPRWGQEDARSVWLAGMLLVAERPVRIVDPQVRAVARALVAQAVRARASVARTPAERTADARGPAPVAGSPGAQPPREAESAAMPIVPADEARAAGSARASSHARGVAHADATSPPMPPIERRSADEPPATGTPTSPSLRAAAAKLDDDGVGRVAAEPTIEDAAREPPSTPIPRAETLRPGDASTTVEPAHASRDDSPRADGLRRDAVEQPAQEHTTEDRAARHRAARDRTPRADIAAPRPVERGAKAGDGERERTDSRAAADPGVTTRRPIHGSATAHAGLFFLLPLASRLGMAGFLAAHRELIELDFPTRLIRHVANRLAIDANDPALATLPPVDGAVRWDGDFVAPDVWTRVVTSSSATWRVRGFAGADSDNRRALTDGSWGLVLAVWRARAPDAVHALYAGSAVARGRPLAASMTMDIALHSWLTAMRRWCHRHAGIGLRALVTRPGRIEATRTHLDVFFDLRQIDIAVRRAGLDIDPGWLPWFGRVVAFHYRREERTDAG